jgi:uncharacterized membrane protein
MTTINTRGAWALCLAASMAAVSLGGCGTEHTDAPSSEEALGTTTLRLSMTSASGKVYRLISAVFDVQGAASRQLEGAPRRYFAKVVIDNSEAEVLGYDWRLIATDSRTGRKALDREWEPSDLPVGARRQQQSRH